MSVFSSRTTYFELIKNPSARRGLGDRPCRAPSLDNQTGPWKSILLDNTEQVRLQTSRSHNRTSEREFDGLLIESLDESLVLLVGEIAKWAVYDGVGRKYGIPRSHITGKLSEFTLALEGIFGVTASTTMTRLVIKRLYSKLGLTFVERPGWRLPDYVTEGRRKMAMFRESIQRPSVCESPLRN